MKNEFKAGLVAVILSIPTIGLARADGGLLDALQRWFPSYPSYPYHPSHPSHPIHPSHPSHPYHPSYPSHPVHASYPSYPRAIYDYIRDIRVFSGDQPKDIVSPGSYEGNGSATNAGRAD